MQLFDDGGVVCYSMTAVKFDGGVADDDEDDESVF